MLKISYCFVTESTQIKESTETEFMENVQKLFKDKYLYIVLSRGIYYVEFELPFIRNFETLIFQGKANQLKLNEFNKIHSQVYKKIDERN